MIPRVGVRGHSFKGAGQYFLHDKKADTSERVEWTHTHNLPTNDAEKAMKWMAFTAMQSDTLKQEAGIASTGRKAINGSVYSYSLAWHPEQKPGRDHMKEKALETLELLGLSEHEAVLVAHNETDHDHVHCIVNLVHPETGKTATLYKDQLKLSEWSLSYEKGQGQVYCEKREANNRARQDKANENTIIKHREDKLKRAYEIQGLYEASDSGKAFNSALKEQGYDLAKGDRRGFVLVDHLGTIHSLSRQLKGQRASDIKQRLADLDLSALPQAKSLSEEKKYFNRERYEADWQVQINEPRGQDNKKDALKISKEFTKRIESKQRIPLNQNPASNRNGLYDGSAGKYLQFWEEYSHIKGRAITQISNQKQVYQEYYASDKNELKEAIALKKKELYQHGGLFSKFMKSKEELTKELNHLIGEVKTIDGYLKGQIKREEIKINKTTEKNINDLKDKYGLSSIDNRTLQNNYEARKHKPKGGQDNDMSLDRG